MSSETTAPSLKWIENNDNSVELPSVYLSEHEIESLIDASESIQGKVLVSLLWDTGARLTEAYELQIGDLENINMSIEISGMSKSRKVPLQKSKPYLKEWLSSHSEKENPQAPLFVQKKGERISFRKMREMIDKAAEGSEMTKKVSPNLIRNSRMAYLRQILSEDQMRAWFGWTGDEKDQLQIKSNCSACPANCSFSSSI